MQMSPFEFVTIFCSLILGLALSHILRAVSDLYEIRDRVKTYWLNSLWVVTVTMWSVYAWWGLWQLSVDLDEWHYAQYWFLVTNLASIYFFTTLVLPKASDDGIIHYSDNQRFLRWQLCHRLLDLLQWQPHSQIPKNITNSLECLCSLCSLHSNLQISL